MITWRSGDFCGPNVSNGRTDATISPMTKPKVGDLRGSSRRVTGSAVVYEIGCVLLSVGSLVLSGGCTRSEPRAESKSHWVGSRVPVTDTAKGAQAPVTSGTALASGAANRSNSASVPPVGPAASSLGTAAELGRVQLTLGERDRKCTLRRGTADTLGVVLPLDAPCGFHHDREGHLRTIKRGEKVIALVESSRADPTSPGDCRTSVLPVAVVVARGIVELAPKSSDVAACLPAMWDEKVFLWPFE